MRDDGGDGSAARTLELVVVEKKRKKEIRPSTWGAGCARERSNHRLRAFLREFGARLCYWGQPRPPSTLLWLCVPTRFNPSSLSSFCLRSPLLLSPSLSLFLSLPCSALLYVAPPPSSPTRMTSVTILLYFPSNPRHPFLFSLTVSSYIFFSFSLFLLSFGTDSPSFSS